MTSAYENTFAADGSLKQNAVFTDDDTAFGSRVCFWLISDTTVGKNG